MKKQLFLFLCTLLSMLAGVQKVQAYTVENLVEDGWTLVNTESVTGVADNFYVLVDAYSSAYVMSAQADHFRPCYKTINSPLENPSFVWSLEGSDNSFKLKSVATGAYIKQASGWNTSVGYPRDGRGVATCTFTLNGGKYDLKCIESNAMVGHWNDGTSGVAEDGENIAANKSTAAADGFFLYAKPKADYIAALAAARQTAVAEASQTNPVEVTSWIQNPDFSNDWGGWECTLSSSGNMQWGQKTLESWNAGNVVVKQVLSGVPDGLYRLSADLISGNNDNKTAYVFAVGAGEVKSDPVSAVASAGNYNTMSAEVAGNTLAANNIVVTNGVLTVGFNQPSGWIVADNFKLYYMGEDMSIYVEAYHNALTNAQGVDQTAPMNGEALTALQSALSTYASVDETSKDALQTATSALSGATAAATASINAYAAGKASLDKVDAILANTNVYTAEAYTTFGEAKLAAQNGYDNRTWTNEEAQAYGSTVFGTGWRTNATIDDFLISAWDAAPRDWSTYHINTWSTTGDSGNPNFVAPCFEYWGGDASTLADKLMTATLGGFAPGATYKVAMTVCAGVNTGVEPSTAPTGVTLQLNDGEAVSVCTGDRIAETRFYEGTFEANATIGTDGNLVIKLNVASTNASWVTWRDVKYTKIADPVDPTPSREAVAVKLLAAEGLLNEVMNADVEAALNAKIAATAGYEESTDIAALEQMANDLDAALTAAQTSVGKYQEAADIINAAVTGGLDAAGQAVYSANETVLQIKAGYDARTLEAATVEQKELCQAALKTAVKAQTTDGADWTLLIDNPGFEGTFTSVANPQANRDIYQPESWTAVWENGNENDMTSLNSSCTQWNNFAEMPQPADGGNNVYWARYRWGNQSSITLKQTINLPAGLYEVGAEGYLSNAVDGKATLSVKFGDEVALTDFTDAAWTKKAVVFSISETQDVEILYNLTESKQVEIKAGVDNFTLTSRAAADADDYAALNAAIKNAESMKVGFKAGEYAPYTNVAVLAPLAAAKAIDQTAVNAKSAVVIATSLLNDAQSAWVENTENMPIVYNGTFVASENNGAPAGWETDNAAGLGGALHARAFVLNPGDGNYDRLASFDQGDATRSAFYVRFDGTNSTRTTDYTYGETVGYTMPLEAGVYRVKLMAGGWGQTQPLNVKFEDAESIIKGEQTVEMTNIADGSGVAASFNFLSEVAAGDYKLVASNGNIDANNAAAFSNVEITLEMTAAELAALREEIILLRTQVEGYTELPEPLATEAAAAVGQAYSYINEHVCDPALLNACKDRLQAVVDAYEEIQETAAAYDALKSALDSYATKVAALDAAGQAAFGADAIYAGIEAKSYTKEEAIALKDGLPARYIAAVKAQTTPGSDMTELINNWDFLGCTNNNFPGWTITSDGGNTWAHGATAVEYWNANHGANFDYYQILTEMPAGKYSLSASMWNTQGTVTGESGVYATSSGAMVFAGVTDDCGDADLHTYSTDVIVVTDGTLRLGVKNNAARKANWFGVDWIKLTYQGAVDVDDYYAAIAEKLTEAQGLMNSVMSAAAETDLTAAVASTEGYTEITDIAALQGMIDGLTAANAAATISVANYEEAAAIITAGSALDEAGKAVYDSNEKVLEVKAAYDNRTLVAVTADQKADCQAAFVVATKAQTTPGSDWTAVIVNPSFEQDFAGWTNNGLAIQNNTSFEKDGVKYAEKWQPNGTFGVSQTITGIPAGVYSISAKSKARGVTSAKIYANGVEKGIVIADITDVYAAEFACDADASITFGFEGTGTGAGSSWLCVDDFHMTLVSAGLPDVLPAVGPMNNTVAEAQTSAIATYNADRTVANYNAAAAAVAAAETSIAAYAEGKATIDKVDGILANTNVYTAEAAMTFGEAHLAAQNGYNNGTWTNEEAQAYGSTVFGTGWRTSNTIDDLLMSAFDEIPEQWNSYHINTWSVEGDNDGSGYTVPFIEYWTGDGETLADKTIHAQMTGLEAGVYTVTALVRQRLSNSFAEDTEVTGLGLSVCGGEVIPSTGVINIPGSRFFMETIEAKGEVFTDGVLDINFVVEGANCSWASIKNVKFAKTGAPTGIKSLNVEEAGALKDGKYLIKGEIIVVKNGKLYKANGQLK